MPNYCSNDLYFRGTPEAIERVKAFIADEAEGAFDFNKVIPYPYRQQDDEYNAAAGSRFFWNPDPTPEIKALQDAYLAKYGSRKDGYNSGGYQWCVDNWSTKWNAINAQYTERDRGPCLTFETAWSPPEKVIQRLAERFGDVSFGLEWFERGMGNQGKMLWPSREDYIAMGGNPETWKAGIQTQDVTMDYDGERGG